MGASTKSKRKGQTLRNLIPLIMQPPWAEMAFIKSGYLDQLHNCPFASLSASVKYILEQNQINRNKCY